MAKLWRRARIHSSSSVERAPSSMAPKEAEKKKDLYAVLGADKGDDAHTISQKYKKLALKYHPDRNRGEGQEAAAAVFKEVSAAYTVLNDPNKRRQYDLRGSVEGDNDDVFQTVDVANLGWFGRFLLAQIRKLGVPIPTSIPPEVLSRACELSEGTALASLPTLAPGLALTGSVRVGGAGSAAFYRIRVTPGMAARGLLVTARARRKNDRFHLILFDARGAPHHQAESLEPERKHASSRAAAKCRLFVVPRPTMLVGMPFPVAEEPHLPPVVAALDTLEERDAAAPPFPGAGDALVALVSANLQSTLDFTIAAAPAHDDAPRYAALDGAADALRQKKRDLATFADKYTDAHAVLAAAQAALDEAKAARDAARDALAALGAEAKGHADSVSDLRAAHHLAQSALLETAFDACDVPRAEPPKPPKSSGLFGALSRPAEPAGPQPARGLDL